MKITFDPTKRADALAMRGLDFEDAAVVFAGPTFETQDLRKDYGEQRIICFGMLGERMVVVGYTPRGANRHVFSMRKANDREQARIAPLLEI
ncbi:MAG: BrnT family toxin [Vitreoscilla sp.]|nr:BrnT family toxin [Burkholderiales bacterium]MBP6339439.1 BrnT family toxin [Vitreoscilla sp.]MBP6676663.1 BrnT family toxin [Vitreoscilla sp.]